jgi:hydroxymethylpyrimidine/phosphomethylpyrimidine kinase
MIPIALTIAGSDSSGGAGIQADLKTFSALGVYGASVITALTAQNTQGVSAIHSVPGDFVAAQIDAVLTDLEVGAIKIGMIGASDAASAVAKKLEGIDKIPVILDPVMVATSGDILLDAGAEDVLRNELIPLADLMTPNLLEAARLLGVPRALDEVAMRAQARDLHDLGPSAVLIKGGHGSGAEAVDILFDGTRYDRVTARRIETNNTHGTGCTLSSAIAALMAHGAGLRDAVFRAKAYITEVLEHANDLQVGKGAGPVHHFHTLWRVFEDG